MQDLTVNGTIKVKLSCTQKLQSFHKTKQFLGSPVKAGNLHNIINAKTSGTIPQKIIFDPRPQTKLTSNSYNAFVRNVTISYKSYHPGSIPIAQLYPPADVYALEDDHDYQMKFLSEQFLDTIGVTAITAEQALDIQMKTCGQTSNPAWFVERCVRIQCFKFQTHL